MIMFGVKMAAETKLGPADKKEREAKEGQTGETNLVIGQPLP